MAGAVFPTNGIEVVASDVTLDLGGFTLRATGGNEAYGVLATGSLRNLRIRNGWVPGLPRGRRERTDR